MFYDESCFPAICRCAGPLVYDHTHHLGLVLVGVSIYIGIFMIIAVLCSFLCWGFLSLVCGNFCRDSDEQSLKQ